MAVKGQRRICYSDIWRAYRNCSFSARLRAVGRYVLCPYDSLLGFFPPGGQILDVGCGDGLLLFLLSREAESNGRTYMGIDPDERRIATARSARIDSVEFRLGEVQTLPSNTYDCVSIMDVLYLLPKRQWVGFLRNTVRVLKRDGLLIVKEVTDRPRRKYWLAYLQEILAIKVFRVTKGDMPHFEPIEVYREHMEAAGVDVFRIDRIDSGRPHPHVLFLARKRS